MKAFYDWMTKRDETFWIIHGLAAALALGLLLGYRASL